MNNQKESPNSGGRIQALATLVGGFVSWSVLRFIIESPVYPPGPAVLRVQKDAETDIRAGSSFLKLFRLVPPPSIPPPPDHAISRRFFR